mgnify:CR=1 FL=1
MAAQISVRNLQLSDPVDFAFFVRLKASFKNLVKARALVSDRRPLYYASNELFSTAITPESHSTSSCGYGTGSSPVVTIILLEICSFQIFSSAGGCRRPPTSTSIFDGFYLPMSVDTSSYAASTLLLLSIRQTPEAL